MSLFDINDSGLIAFVVLFDTPAIETRFVFHELSIKRCLEVVGRATIPVTREIMESMDVKASRRNSILKLSQFPKGENLGLHELGAEQIFQGLRACLVVHMYALNYSLN